MQTTGGKDRFIQGSSLRKLNCRHHEYLCHKWPWICSTCKHFPVLSSLMVYQRFVTEATRWVTLVEQELISPQEHMS